MIEKIKNQSEVILRKAGDDFVTIVAKAVVKKNKFDIDKKRVIDQFKLFVIYVASFIIVYNSMSFVLIKDIEKLTKFDRPFWTSYIVSTLSIVILCVMMHYARKKEFRKKEFNYIPLKQFINRGAISIIAISILFKMVHNMPTNVDCVFNVVILGYILYGFIKVYMEVYDEK